MKIRGSVVLRAGITWGIVAVLLAILAGVLSPILPEVGELSLATFALLMAGVHYTARARADFLQAAIGGALSGMVAAVFLVLLQLINLLSVPLPSGAPGDLLNAVIAGLIAGAAGGLGYKVIER